jgi:hypothetical protein
VSITQNQAGREQVVLLGAEPDRPKHLGPRVVGLVAYPWQEASVVAGVAGVPPLGFTDLAETFLAVSANRLQQPIAGLKPTVFGHDQRPRHQAGQQLEDGVWVDTLTTADRLGGL